MKNDIIVLRLNTIIGALRIISNEVNGINADLFGEEPPQAPETPTPTPPEPPPRAEEEAKPKTIEFSKEVRKGPLTCYSDSCKYSSKGSCTYAKALSSCDGRVIH